MNSLPAVMQATLAALALTAAVYDIRFRRIPNWLVVLGFLAGLGLNIWFSGRAGATAACLGAALAFIFYFPLFALRATGAGDLKLMVAIATFCGPSNWVVLFIFTAILGGVLALGLILYRG